MNIVVDHGNTSAKIGIFDHHVLKEKHTFEKIEDLIAFLVNFYGDWIIISSVNHALDLPPTSLSHFKHSLNLTPETPLPIQNQYGSPATLGMDRIAAVCGAWQLFPHQNSLIIDAGTCITYDIIDSMGQYQGGSISPGLFMRFRAMHTFTARLPLVEPVNNPDLTGKTTATCMQSGVIFGMIDEIDGVIDRYRKNNPDLKVILCGGDAPFFENKLKASIFASPELVLIGLNRILLHNADL